MTLEKERGRHVNVRAYRDFKVSTAQDAAHSALQSLSQELESLARRCT